MTKWFHQLCTFILAVAAPFANSMVSASDSEYAKAYQFLNQSTMGATRNAAEKLALTVASPEGLESWIDEQVAVEPSLLIPFMVDGILSPDFVSSHGVNPDVPWFVYADDQQRYRLYAWMDNALFGEDQLRQRVTWALSQLFVVSDRDTLFGENISVAHFYDTLSINAFGNYRELLEAVTLHPAMGVYLSMLGNRRQQEGTNIRPDENYAREALQLFSVGQVMLNDDGSLKKDASGASIPTYDQKTIEGFAKVYTGWSYSCPPPNESECTSNNIHSTYPMVPNSFDNFRGWGNEYVSNLTLPMQPYPDAHDDGVKQLLNYPGVALPNGLLPPGLGAVADLEAALDNIFHHPNVPPFISKFLIQKLVTSNPSPDFVNRVSQVFKNDGDGVRGNLLAVIKSILLDPEARGFSGDTVTSGKLKEPLLRLIHLWRAYEAFSPSGRTTTASFCCPVGGESPAYIFGQSPTQAPSVFNFFEPDFRPEGGLFGAGQVGPEFQISTENIHIQMGWFFHVQSMIRTSERVGGQGDDAFYLNIEEEIEVADDIDAIIDMIGIKLLGSSDYVPAALRQECRAMINLLAELDETNGIDRSLREARVSEALFMFLLSPEFAVQR